VNRLAGEAVPQACRLAAAQVVEWDIGMALIAPNGGPDSLAVANK
jgi:hypothetical protein